MLYKYRGLFKLYKCAISPSRHGKMFLFSYKTEKFVSVSAPLRLVLFLIQDDNNYLYRHTYFHVLVLFRPLVILPTKDNTKDAANEAMSARSILLNCLVSNLHHNCTYILIVINVLLWYCSFMVLTVRSQAHR